MNIKLQTHKFLRRFGVDLCRFSPTAHPLARRQKLFADHRIDLVLDVGANAGQFGHELRQEVGYRGKIISFEPYMSAYHQLAQCAGFDGNWIAVHCALGAAPGYAELNVAGNSQSSSLLDMMPAHLQSAPESKYITTQQVEIQTLDNYLPEHQLERNIYLKEDTQGFEKPVLDGAERSLEHVRVLQVEMSLTPMYRNEMPFHEMCRHLEGKGFRLVGIEPVFADPQTGHLLQADGTFVREASTATQPAS